MARAARRRTRVSARSRSGGGGERRIVEAEPTGETSQTVSQSSLGAGLAPADSRRNPFGFLRRLQPRFVADVISELRKVTWPTLSETRYLTFVVAVVSLAIGLLLGAFDLLFGRIIERLFF
ncbi:MAG TPA: preprotein translocase subunit SecE [Dehalococcoidia bacterium]|nr:preprotein translocase subunit SecE [Dehalococcoidia bacterium]